MGALMLALPQTSLHSVNLSVALGFHLLECKLGRNLMGGIGCSPYSISHAESLPHPQPDGHCLPYFTPGPQSSHLYNGTEVPTSQGYLEDYICLCFYLFSLEFSSGSRTLQRTAA